MRTRVTMPVALFRAAERLARRKGIARSQLYAEAVAAFIAAEDDAVTRQLDEAYGRNPDSLDNVLRELPSRIIEPERW